MKRGTLLDKAKSLVCKDRDGQYGRPEDSFKTIADLWTAYTGHWITPVDVAVMLALLKIARLKGTRGKHSDSWVDLAGYAACGSEIALGEEGEDLQC